MNRVIIFLMIILSVVVIKKTGYAQTYKWLKGGGSTDVLTSASMSEGVYHVCADANGNVYGLSIIGNTGPIVADTFSRPGGAYGNNQNVLFFSYNCTGQMRFAKLISSWGTIPQGVMADNSGHVYVATDVINGTSYGTWLRIGYDTVISGYLNSREALIQFDTSGHFNWISFVGDNTTSTRNGTGEANNFLAIDGDDKPHLVAMTKYGVQLTPSILSHNGFYDHTFDASGNLLSVKGISIDSTLWVYGLAVDKQSNKLFAYGIRNYVSFPTLSRYPFIAAFDTSRNLIWVDTISNPFYPGSGNFTSIATDGTGHVYGTIGSARGYVYRGDTAVNVVGTATDAITTLLKLDTSGALFWKRVFSSTVTSGITGAAVMAHNRIAVGGSIAGGMIVAGTDTVTAYTGEGQNAIFAIVDSAGYVQEFRQLHGAGFYDRVNVSASDNVGNLYLGGKVESNIWAGSLTPYSSVGGDSDYFIIKYGVDCSCTAMPVADYTYSGLDLTRSFAYTGTTSGIDSVRWYFGDGGTSTSMTPTHTYTAAGTFTTCVRAYSTCGNDMRCHEVTVTCPPTLVLSGFTDTGNYVRGFTFTGTTTYYDSVTWDFGDGSYDTGLNVIHTFSPADTYHVCAKVYTRCDTNTWCKDVIVIDTLVSVMSLVHANQDVRVYPNPTSGDLVVSGVIAPAQYRLYNAIGVEVLSGGLITGSNHVALASIPPGVYLMELVGPSQFRKQVRILKR